MFHLRMKMHRNRSYRSLRMVSRMKCSWSLPIQFSVPSGASNTNWRENISTAARRYHKTLIRHTICCCWKRTPAMPLLYMTSEECSPMAWVVRLICRPHTNGMKKRWLPFYPQKKKSPSPIWNTALAKCMPPVLEPIRTMGRQLHGFRRQWRKIINTPNIPSAAFITVVRVCRRIMCRRSGSIPCPLIRETPMQIMSLQKCTVMVSVHRWMLLHPISISRLPLPAFIAWKRTATMTSCNTALVRCSTPEPVRIRMCSLRFPIWRNRRSLEM